MKGGSAAIAGGTGAAPGPSNLLITRSRAEECSASPLLRSGAFDLRPKAGWFSRKVGLQQRIATTEGPVSPVAQRREAFHGLGGGLLRRAPQREVGVGRVTVARGGALAGPGGEGGLLEHKLGDTGPPI